MGATVGLAQRPAVPPPRGTVRAALGAGLLFAEFTHSEPGAAGRRPPELRDGGGLMPPPLCVVPTAAGALLVARLLGAADALELRCPGAAPVPLLPQGEALELLAARDAAESLRLLRFLAGTGAMTLRVARDPAFCALLHGLAARLAVGELRPLTCAGESRAVLALPGHEGAPLLLTRSGLHRLSPPRDGLLLLPAAPAQGAILLPSEGAPLRLGAPHADAPDLPGLARGALRPRLLALLQPEPALARDIQLLAPARVAMLDSPALPIGGALELALPDPEGGAFLRGWLRDPLDLVEQLALRLPDGTLRALPPGALLRTARPDLAPKLAACPQGDGGARPGFLAHVPEGIPPGMAQLGLALRLASGRVLDLVAPPGLLPPARARDLVLGAADSADAALLDRCISPAAARFQRAAMAALGTPERIAFGPRAAAPRQPLASIVVPLWRNLSFLPAQLAAFARDPQLRRCELVFVLDSPEDRDVAETRLADLAALHGLRLSLLAMPLNGGYAAACNAGAAIATAPLLVLLNSDVVPDRAGWLGALRARFARDPALVAVGARLLYGDGAIQHAGLHFFQAEDGVWACGHPWKGWPGSHAPANRARRVPAVTGAALAVTRAAFEAAGGICTDYILGDCEDADLCLKLRAAGGEIGYAPAATLLHWERQSIAAHPGHCSTLAAAHNRRLLHARWAGAIADLAARFPVP
jgi:GT2 family glycosyltransferase